MSELLNEIILEEQQQMIAKVKSRRSIMRKGITCRKSVLPYVDNAVRRGTQARDPFAKSSWGT